MRREKLDGVSNARPTTVRLRLLYDGTLPNVWDGGAADFGLQDKAEALLRGSVDAEGRVAFDLSLDVKPGAPHPIFLGDFAHGPPKERFLYLSWRQAHGTWAQRLKLPLGQISWADLERAQDRGLVGVVAPSAKPRAPGRTNVGGTRAVRWRPA